MNCRCSCGYLALLAGIFAGIIVGVLYSLGFVGTGVAFLLYLALGILGLLLTPLYGLSACGTECAECFARYRRPIVLSAVATVLTAVLGIILAPLATAVVLAIVLGVATLFAVLLLAILICLVRCVE